MLRGAGPVHHAEKLPHPPDARPITPASTALCKALSRAGGVRGRAERRSSAVPAGPAAARKVRAPPAFAL